MRRVEPEMQRGAIPPMGQGLAVIGTLVLVAAVFLLAIAGYLVTLRINEHHRTAAAIDRRIAAVREDSERLRVELMIRSRFPELQRWGETLGLGTPRVVAQLASPRDLVGRAPAPAPVPGSRAPAPVRVSYAPKARHQLDDLIGAIQ